MSSPLPSSPSSSVRARGFLAHVKRAIDARLQHHLAAARSRAQAAGPAASTIALAVEKLVQRGGKRFRPALLAASFIAAGGRCEGDDQAPELSDALLDAGCAWELLQAYFLIHDDWMDGDETRRGGPTVHVELAAHHHDVQLGAASAILAGDFACALAHRVLLEADAPSDVVQRSASEFSRVHEEVVFGQAIDLTLGAADRAAVERMHALKTGSYTVRGPLAVGALFARAQGDVAASLDRYAAPLGVAFQVRDDLLGTFGDPIETGKPVGSDLRARKRTALVVEAMARLEGADAARFEEMITAQAAPSDDRVRAAMTLIERCGARAAVEARLSSLVAEAKTAASDQAFSPIGSALLDGFAHLLGSRSV